MEVVVFGLHVHLGYLAAWFALSCAAALLIARGIGRVNRDDGGLDDRQPGSCWENAQRGPASFGRNSIVPEEREEAAASESQRMASLEADEAIRQAWQKGRAVP